MKLSVAQTTAFCVIGVMMLVLLADIIGIINIPAWIFVATVLPVAITAHRVLPSLKELERQSRPH